MHEESDFEEGDLVGKIRIRRLSQREKLGQMSARDGEVGSNKGETVSTEQKSCLSGVDDILSDGLQESN